MKNYGLESKINGVNAMDYMSDLIERNERQDIEIERCKLSIGILKQKNNYSRLLIDAAKFELKKREYDDKNKPSIPDA